jgi:hypothetical protein
MVFIGTLLEGKGAGQATGRAVVPAKAGTQYSRCGDLRIEVEPMRVLLLDPSDLPRAIPFLDLLLPLDRCLDAGMDFELVTPT